jgi:hypothetical protein
VADPQRRAEQWSFKPDGTPKTTLAHDGCLTATSGLVEKTIGFLVSPDSEVLSSISGPGTGFTNQDSLA